MCPFFFDPSTLSKLAQQHRESYATAQPFPHAVLDDLLPSEVAETVLTEFPTPEQIPWIQWESPHNRKLACQDETMMGPCTRQVFAQLHSWTFVNFLQELSGLDGLIPDPELCGAGLNQIVPTGFLEVHADFNVHPRTNLDRRMNLILYLNREWKEEYGGHLELWSHDASRCEKKILPIFNRCVIFTTTDASLHGHPHPLACPRGMTRKSVTTYYYSHGRPSHDLRAVHSTLWKSRPVQSTSVVTRILKKFLPPIVLDVARLAKRRIRRRTS